MTTNPQLVDIINYLCGQTSKANVSPATYYVGLCTGGVALDGTITGEINGGGYSRAPLTNNKTYWSTATTSGTVTLIKNVTFPESVTDWGDITTVFISAGPNASDKAIYYMNLTTPKHVGALVTVYFKGDPDGVDGDITMSVSN